MGVYSKKALLQILYGLIIPKCSLKIEVCSKLFIQRERSVEASFKEDVFKGVYLNAPILFGGKNAAH